MKQQKHEAGRFDGNERRGTPTPAFIVGDRMRLWRTTEYENGSILQELSAEYKGLRSIFITVASKGLRLRGALFGMQCKEAKGRPARRAVARGASAPNT
jgi:hypothetical protein